MYVQVHVSTWVIPSPVQDSGGASKMMSAECCVSLRAMLVKSVTDSASRPATSNALESLTVSCCDREVLRGRRGLVPYHRFPVGGRGAETVVGGTPSSVMSSSRGRLPISLVIDCRML